MNNQNEAVKEKLEKIFEMNKPIGFELGHFDQVITDVEQLILEAIQKAREEERERVVKNLVGTHCDCIMENHDYCSGLDKEKILEDLKKGQTE